MPNASFETKVRSIDLTIQINDISEETANRIKRFITEEMLRPDPFADILIAERDAAKAEPLPEIKEDPESEVKTAVALEHMTRQQKRVIHTPYYNEVVGVLAGAKKDANKYDWRWAKSEEFCREYAPDLGITELRGNYRGFINATINVGTVLGGLSRDGSVKKMQGRCGVRYGRFYWLPFKNGSSVGSNLATQPKEPASLVEETPKPATVSARLREYRERSGLGTDEVSELIGYPESVVKAWEAGTNVPSREGRGQIEALFGKHIFDGVQKPVIW